MPCRHPCRRKSNYKIIKENKTVYGINTGFGALANTRIKLLILKHCNVALYYHMLQEQVNY